MADDINVTNNNLYLYVPNLIPNVETQVMSNEATQKNYEISFDEYYTERRLISDTITQLDIGSSQKVNGPKYPIGAHRTRTRADTANKINLIAMFDNLNFQKSNVEIDSERYPRDSVLIIYEQNDYIEQYEDLKFFFKVHIGEKSKTPFISYHDMKTKYPIEIIDLRHQPDLTSLKKIQLFYEYSADSENAKFCLRIFRRREIELISDGYKLIEGKVI